MLASLCWGFSCLCQMERPPKGQTWDFISNPNSMLHKCLREKYRCNPCSTTTGYGDSTNLRIIREVASQTQHIGEMEDC